MKQNLTEGTEWKKILLFALPIIAGQLLQQLYNTVDGIVVGNYVSSGALAAVGSCATLAWVFLALALGMSTGAGIVISQFFGAQKYKDLRSAVSTALILLGALGLAFSALGAVSARFIMTTVLNIEDPAIREMAIVYFRIYSAGLLFQYLYNCVASILRSIGDSRATLYFLIISTVLNMVLDVLFTAVFNMGVAGVAIATVISQLVCIAVSLLYMFRKYEMLRLSKSDKLFDGEKLRLCLKMGIPAAVQQLIISCGTLAVQRLVNSFGEVTMAAFTVGTRFDQYLSVPTMGIFMALSSFCGQNTGAGRYDRIKRGMASSIIMSLAIVSVMCVFVCIFAYPLAALFGVSGETQRQSVECIRFVSCGYLVFAVYIPLNGLFQGCGQPLAATAVSLLSLCVRVACSYSMVYVFGLGYASCWQSTVIGWSCATVLAVVHYFRGTWKTKGLVKRQPEPEEN